MTWIDALLLGIIQGLTEFLQVSSSGHLEIGSVLLGVKSSNHLLFALIVHLATSLSTLVVFRKEIVVIIVDLFKFKWNDSTKFASQIVISMIPVGIVGLLFESEIETFFTGNLLLTGGMLIFTSALLFIPRFFREGEGSVTFMKSLLIGIAQAVAIVPGISRSGSTIATALILGIERDKAAKFSFLMVLLPIIGASLLKAKNYFEAPAIYDKIDSGVLVLGFTAAFVSGYIACNWMVRIVKKGKLIYFSIYCFLVGFIAVLSSFIL